MARVLEEELDHVGVDGDGLFVRISDNTFSTCGVQIVAELAVGTILTRTLGVVVTASANTAILLLSLLLITTSGTSFTRLSSALTTLEKTFLDLVTLASISNDLSEAVGVFDELAELIDLFETFQIEERDEVFDTIALTELMNSVLCGFLIVSRHFL
jgi:hypothetical protein